MNIRKNIRNLYKCKIKFQIDFILALVAIIILFPVFLIASLAIMLDSNGPAIFKQERLGLQGKIFTIYKFRSMVSDQKHYKRSKGILEDDPRITRVGRFIRKTSIDELPQIFNIIRGEMSFIGPRPPTVVFPKNFEEYNEIERKRFFVRPGISGLAQIRCREVHDWDINIAIDIEYVDNYSFLYDAKLFFLSLFVFFKTDNIYTRD